VIRRRYIVVGVVLAVGVLLILTVVRGFTLYDDAMRGRTELEAAYSLVSSDGMAITAERASEVTAHLAAADTALSRAEGTLAGDPLIAWLRPLPVAGTQLDAVAGVLSATREITSRHEVVNSVMAEVINARDGKEGPERLAAIARLTVSARPQIDELLAAFERADGKVATIAEDGLLGPVAAARQLLADRFAQMRPIVAGGRSALDIVPTLMGIGGKSRYLVLALDNAEVRPIGGLIGAFATPTFTDGVLSDLTFRDILSVDRVDQKEYVKPPDPLSDHLLNIFTWQVADAGWWPDFADNAAEARRMFEIETGDGDFQGTIAFTPELVDALLRVVGPVEIPTTGITVHPGETYLVSLEQVEVLNRGEGRKQFLADLASTVLQRLYALPPARYPEIAAALGTAGPHRRLQVLLDDDAARHAVTEMGWYRPFTFPEDADRLAIMEANVAPVSKLNVLLDMGHVLDVALQPDGSAEEVLETTFTNNYGPVLPRELERVRSSFSSGNLGSYQRRYIDPRAEIQAVESSDLLTPVTDPDDVTEEHGSLVVGNYQFIRPGEVTLDTTYTVVDVVRSADPATTGTYRLAFFKQPGRDLDTLRVNVTVPPGATPTTWSEGGTVDGPTVSFTVGTATDHEFVVTYGPG
jgi:uncharacterized protein DUF4012